MDEWRQKVTLKIKDRRATLQKKENLDNKKKIEKRKLDVVK